jgi:hypothetical protein
MAFARDSASSAKFSSKSVILGGVIILLLPLRILRVIGTLLETLVVRKCLLNLTLVYLFDGTLVGTSNDTLSIFAIAALEYASTISHFYI